MNWDLTIVIVLLLCTIVMFILNKPRMDAVALLMMTALPLTGIITVEEALAGLSDPNVVLIAALFVIGEGLVRTGVAQKLGDMVVERAGNNEIRLIVLLMVVVAGIGSVMSSTGVVAIFIPAVIRIARNTRIHPGRLFMPLSIAALISGMITLIATPPNLLIHSELLRAGYDGFHFFSFSVFGLPILAVAIVYMVIVRRLLGQRKGVKSVNASPEKPNVSQWLHEYKLPDNVYQLYVTASSPWVNKQLGVIEPRVTEGISIIAIERQRRFAPIIVQPGAHTVLRAGDILYVDFVQRDHRSEALPDTLRRLHLSMKPNVKTDVSQTVGMAELMIPAESNLIGKTAIEARFRSLYHLSIIGIKRGKRSITEAVENEKLRLGDTLLVAGPWRAIRRLRTDPGELIVLQMPAELDDVIALPSRAPYAIGTLLVVIGLMISGIVPNVLAALIGCILLGVFRCINIDRVYRTIQWPTLFLIVGMLPFSIALQKTGGVDWIVNSMLSMVGTNNVTMLLVAVYGITAILGLFISNTATAVLMAPVAIALATELEIAPHAFGMTVALASSAAFMTPISSPVNTLVLGPGNYKFTDFVKVGIPLFFIVMVLSVVLIRLIYPYV